MSIKIKKEATAMTEAPSLFQHTLKMMLLQLPDGYFLFSFFGSHIPRICLLRAWPGASQFCGWGLPHFFQPLRTPVRRLWWYSKGTERAEAQMLALLCFWWGNTGTINLPGFHRSILVLI